MRLEVKRIAKKDSYTIGNLFVDGVYVCDTLEDAVRTTKVYGKTAIPIGTYEITMDVVSPRFKDRSWAKPYNGKLPRLLNVPNFEGVLIHVGNNSSDTSGCLLVGKNSIKGMVTDSINTFNKLMNNYLVPAHKRGEKITITIE